MKAAQRLAAALALSGLLGAGCTTAAALRAAPEQSTVLVVRHAERAPGTDPDPPLSDAGRARVRALRDVAERADVTVIYATQYRRTRETAAGVAEGLRAEVLVRPIDAGNAATYAVDLAEEISTSHRGATVLVVGHSNTVPALVEALTGRRVAPMEESEYDRLYRVVRDREGELVLTEERFGPATR